jgi:DNA-binding PadR family transcriptional regulator
VPDEPLCPLVLSLLAAGPRTARDVARVLERRHGAGRGAAAALGRLAAAGLVWGPPARRGRSAYRLTRRGRSELALQRLLWSRAAGR